MLHQTKVFFLFKNRYEPWPYSNPYFNSLRLELWGNWNRYLIWSRVVTYYQSTILGKQNCTEGIFHRKVYLFGLQNGLFDTRFWTSAKMSFLHHKQKSWVCNVSFYTRITTSNKKVFPLLNNETSLCQKDKVLKAVSEKICDDSVC